MSWEFLTSNIFQCYVLLTHYAFSVQHGVVLLAKATSQAVMAMTTLLMFITDPVIMLNLCLVPAADDYWYMTYDSFRNRS